MAKFESQQKNAVARWAETKAVQLLDVYEDGMNIHDSPGPSIKAICVGSIQCFVFGPLALMALASMVATVVPAIVLMMFAPGLVYIALLGTFGIGAMGIFSGVMGLLESRDARLRQQPGYNPDPWSD